MKLKHFFGLAVMTVVTIITLAGCASLAELFKVPEFPSDFTGTWERVDQKYPHTLTLTSTTIKASNQSSYWNILSISGDLYAISEGKDTRSRGTINIKLVGNNLEIIDVDDDPYNNNWVGGENDWTGTWKRK